MNFASNFKLTTPVRLLVATVMLVLFAGSLTRPYIDHDVLMYSEIGRAIFDRGFLPYEFAFDHKPMAVYYIYGLISVLLPLHFPIFQFVTIGMLLVTAVLVKNMVGKESLGLHFLLLVAASYPFIQFSGNTEIFYTFFAMLSLFFLVKAGRAQMLLLAGAVAAVSFNINYLGFFLIGPTAIYLLVSGSQNAAHFGKRILVYAAGFLAGIFLLFLPYLLKNPALIGAYFSAQAEFLNAYGKSYRKLPWYFVMKVSPLPILALISIKCAPADARLRNALIIMIFSGILGVLSSGKYFLHYGYIMVPAAIALVTLSINPFRWIALVVALAIFVLPSGRTFLRGVGAPAEWEEAYDFGKYRELKGLVGEEKVLSVRASHVPIFYANLNVAQRFIWVDHAYMLYGPKEDGYDADLMTPKLRFVLMPPSLCEPANPERLEKTCQKLKENYEVAKNLTDWYWPAVTLYRRKD